MPEGELRQVLVELRDLLDDADEQFWAGWARDRLVALDSGALDPREVRRAFGGMGSLNDLLLDPFNGHTIEPDEVDALNARLRDLSSRLWVVTG